jgi:hypothetical protein
MTDQPKRFGQTIISYQKEHGSPETIERCGIQFKLARYDRAGGYAVYEMQDDGETPECKNSGTGI